jgi:hypothetical protein
LASEFLRLRRALGGIKQFDIKRFDAMDGEGRVPAARQAGAGMDGMDGMDLMDGMDGMDKAGTPGWRAAGISESGAGRSILSR